LAKINNYSFSITAVFLFESNESNTIPLKIITTQLFDKNNGGIVSVPIVSGTVCLALTSLRFVSSLTHLSKARLTKPALMNNTMKSILKIKLNLRKR
jgi:hypothetical protein